MRHSCLQEEAKVSYHRWEAHTHPPPLTTSTFKRSSSVCLTHKASPPPPPPNDAASAITRQHRKNDLSLPQITFPILNGPHVYVTIPSNSHRGSSNTPSSCHAPPKYTPLPTKVQWLVPIFFFFFFILPPPPPSLRQKYVRNKKFFCSIFPSIRRGGKKRGFVNGDKLLERAAWR